jgi:hypothetical protein
MLLSWNKEKKLLSRIRRIKDLKNVYKILFKKIFLNQVNNNFLMILEIHMVMQMKISN